MDPGDHRDSVERHLLEEEAFEAESVSRSDGHPEKRPGRAHRKPSILQWPLRIGSALLMTLGLLKLVDLFESAQVWSSKSLTSLTCDCGNSTQEAMSMGCQYDALAAAWLPPHCRDDELTAEFNSIGDGPNGTWLYYSDPQASSILSLEQVAMLADEHKYFYASRRWHIAHCGFNWEKLRRSSVTGVQIERRYSGRRHVMHCLHEALKDEPVAKIGTVAGVELHSDEASDS